VRYDGAVRKPRLRTDKALRLMSPPPSEDQLAQLARKASYQGCPKHKEHPQQFGLPLYNQSHGDSTLCDRDAGFGPGDLQYVRSWLGRGIKAGLVGDSWESEAPRAIWAVGDNGWIFEGRITNSTQFRYDGYPVLPDRPMARMVYDRFRDWFERHPKSRNQDALAKCAGLYGLKK